MDDTQIYLAKLANDNSAKQMNWQKLMSDTSHQREVLDLKKAGLNPVLSSNSGAQSYTTSVDSAVNAIGNIESSKISSNAAIQAASISAAAQRYAADQARAAAQYNTDNSKNGSVPGMIERWLRKAPDVAKSTISKIVSNSSKINNAALKGKILNFSTITKADKVQIDSALKELGVVRITNYSRQQLLNFITTQDYAYLRNVNAQRFY